MDVAPTQERSEATTASTNPDNTPASSELTPSSSAPTTTDQRATRSSARTKAHRTAQDTPAEPDSAPAEPAPLSTAASSTSARLTRSSAKRAHAAPSNTKGKAKATQPEETAARLTRRPRRAAQPTAVTTTPLTINEPTKDTKGKKRAHPDTSLEEDAISGTASSASSKRPRTSTSAYSLRSRDISSSASATMPRKPKNSPAKAKPGNKNKSLSAASSSRMDDDDVEMFEAEFSAQASHACADDDDPESSGDRCDPSADADASADRPAEGAPSVDSDDDGENGGGDDAPAAAPPSGAGAGGPESGNMDEAAAMAAIFGDFRQFGSYMMGMSTRLKNMLNNIKMTADPTTRLVTLQELSEILSMSTEDTLAGSFPVEGYVRELVRILGGSGKYEDDEDGDGDDDMKDEDAALAAALAMSNGGSFVGDENLEAQVLACRCLANLMEALPGVAHTIVYHGALPVLCSKLIEISYIDLAEQTLSTLEKISEEFPSAIVREGGLGALLNYLDFFSIAVQRTALQAASNCCRNFAAEHFSMLKDVWPIIRNCLSYSDQRLVEFAALCIIRVIDSFHRSQVDHLEALVDRELIKAVNLLLLPAGGSPLVATNTFTLLLRALATSARASPKITVVLLEADIVDTLYQILTGVLPSASEAHTDEGDAEGGQGLGGGLADMTVMENLAHRPKDQVEEALSLLSELLPPLPKDGVFDHKSYTEKSLGRLVKAKVKAERAAARQAAADATSTNAETVPTAPGTPPPEIISVETAVSDDTPSGELVPADSASQNDGQDGDEMALPPPVQTPKEPAPDRTEMLRAKSEVVGRFLRLTVPVLVDVYAASVISSVRTKTLTGLLKAVAFLDEDGLGQVLKFVPVASFASSILSSKDHPHLVIGALQLVDMLLAKVPAQYKPAFLREGVFHEIEIFAARAIISPKSKEKERDASENSTPAEPVLPTLPSSIPAALLASIPGFKKLSSMSMDPEDAITLRARIIRFKYLGDNAAAAADGVLGELRRLGTVLSSSVITEDEAQATLTELSNLFCAAESSVSSFELLQSGVVDSLVQYATAKDWMTPIDRRQQVMFDTLNGKQDQSGHAALAVLVKKLQESLTRMESYEVVTVSQGLDDAKRSSPSLLARQLRLRLVAADEADIPKSLNNIVVSIHAIATFQALHDYLRPRVAGLLSGGSRLSSMLAALAASGMTPPPMPSSSRAPTVGSASSSSKPPAPPPAPPKADSSSAASQTIGRRRSQRLSAKKGPSAAAPEASEAAPETPGASATVASGSQVSPLSSPEAATVEPPATRGPLSSEMAGSETLVPEDEAELAADFTDDEVDADVFNEVEDEADVVVSEKTITVSVADDGSRVEAQTPEGTRVATPNPATKTIPAAIARQASAGRASYAAALKAKPTDWHLEFSMEGNVLPLDLTIYGAIHQQETRKSQGTPFSTAMIWQGVHTIKFKKVPGPAPSPDARNEENPVSRSRSVSPSFASLPDDASHTKILRLLRLLHKLNLAEHERNPRSMALAETAFVNNKLTAKLTRQLEEPMIVASSCLPDWALDLPQHFPFLFPFATRYNFLQSTSFGYARLILKWQSQQTRGQDSSRRDDNIAFLGRLQRQKVRISRKHILESAVKVFEMYGSSSSVLEVEYFEEVGTGLGPTLEFYSLASKEFARKSLKLWRDNDASPTGIYVNHPHGLYPSPMGADEPTSDAKQRRTHLFRVVGQFVAKAMLDSRIIDMSFNKVFLKLVLGEDVPLTIDTLKLVDPELAASLSKLRGYAAGYTSKSEDAVNIADLSLDFTLPGYDLELRHGGKEITVTTDNVDEYIHEVLHAILGRGAKSQTQAFRDGFSKVFPVMDLQAFTADELVMLFGNTDEDWTIETLSEALKADHGFNVESRAIRNLVDIMSEYDVPTRRAYLQFITGSPKLPIGGFRGLNPALTVVRKPHEAPLTADDYLPSVMTCVNYLKLPEYSSKDVMREKLRVAMKEGVGSFHLS